MNEAIYDRMKPKAQQEFVPWLEEHDRVQSTKACTEAGLAGEGAEGEEKKKKKKKKGVPNTEAASAT